MSMKSKTNDEFHVHVMDGWDINSVDPCTWDMVGCSAEGYVMSLVITYSWHFFLKL